MAKKRFKESMKTIIYFLGKNSLHKIEAAS